MPKKLENKKLEKHAAGSQPLNVDPQKLDRAEVQQLTASEDVHTAILQSASTKLSARQQAKIESRTIKNVKILKLVAGDDTRKDMPQTGTKVWHKNLENESIQKPAIFDVIQTNKLQDAMHRKLENCAASDYVHDKTLQNATQQLSTYSMAVREKEQLLAQIQAGSSHTIVFQALKGKILRYSHCPNGCRVVQEALTNEICLEPDEKRWLLEELHGHVQALCSSPHGNFVIQVIVETYSIGVTSFVAEELMGQHVKVAKNKYGCRVLQRLAEHHLLNGNETTARFLFDAFIEENLQELCMSLFGRYVIKSTFEQGSERQKNNILTAMTADPNFYARTSTGASILEQGMRAYEHIAEHLASAFVVGAEKDFIKTARSYNGSIVVRTLLESNTPHAETIRRMMSSPSTRVRSNEEQVKGASAKLENEKMEKHELPQHMKNKSKKIENKKTQKRSTAHDIHNEKLQGVAQKHAARQQVRAMPKKFINKTIQKPAADDDAQSKIRQNANPTPPQAMDMLDYCENDTSQKLTPVGGADRNNHRNQSRKSTTSHRVNVMSNKLKTGTNQKPVPGEDIYKDTCQNAMNKIVARSMVVSRQKFRAAREYLIIEETEQILEQIEMGSCRAIVFHALENKVLRHSHCPNGCKVVQKALIVETCLKQDEKRRLVKELHGHAHALCLCPYGNLVIQVIVKTFEVDVASFVVEELKDHYVKIATNRYGCRVLQRLVEHQLLDEKSTIAQLLFDDLLRGNLHQLCKSFFGRRVIHSLFVKGPTRQKHNILIIMVADPNVYARTSVGASILKAAARVDGQIAEHLASAFVARGEEELLKTAHSYNGSFVIRTLLTTKTFHTETIQKIVSLQSTRLRSTAIKNHSNNFRRQQGYGVESGKFIRTLSVDSNNCDA